MVNNQKKTSSFYPRKLSRQPVVMGPDINAVPTNGDNYNYYL